MRTTDEPAGAVDLALFWSGPMYGLAPYLAGGIAGALLLNLLSPLDIRSDRGVAPEVAVNVVDRLHKGDRLRPSDNGIIQSRPIASVEVIGLRNAAIVYRDSDGRQLFRTDPVTNVTIVVKGVVLPEVTIRDTDRTLVKPRPVELPRELPPPHRLPPGCDPAFSPLSNSASSPAAGRCLVGLDADVKRSRALDS